MNKPISTRARSTNHAKAARDVLGKGGELGKLISAYDWASTPLGPIEDWSQSLKTAVGILVHSPVPIVMLWGPDGIMIYNDAYSVFAGGRHPRLLGSKVREGWPEVADFNDNVMRVCLSGGTLAYKDQELTLYRTGSPEQVWMNLDYSPVFDEAGKPAGVIAIVIETTERVAAERRRQAAEVELRAERDRVRSVLDGMTEGFALLDRGFRILDINAEGLRLETRPREAIVGLTHWEAYPGTEDSELGRLYKRAMAERVPVALEHRYVWEDGRAAWLDMRAYVIEQGLAIFYRDVTARKAADAALRESEERFRNLADHAPVMMWVTDPSGYCTYLNRRWYEFTGQSVPEAEGVGWLDATHPGDKAAAEGVFREANERRAPFRLEYRLRRADGVYRWAIDAAAPRFGPGGEFLGYVGSVIDIDERREIEEALRKSEAHLAAVFEQATAGFCETDFTGRFMAANARYCEIVGRSREELLSLRMQDITHPDDLSANLVQFERLAQHGEPFQIEKRYVRPDGANVWVRNAVSVLRGADGQPDNIFAVTTDIDERRRIEDALRQSEARFEAIANSIDQLIWSTRPDGYHDYYNQRWYEYTGVPVGSTDGEAWNGMFHPDDQERAWAVWQHSLATGEPYHIEYRLRHRSGHYRWVLGRAQPVRDGRGRIARWFGTCTDIHALKVAEEERARAVAELRESETRLRELNETLERRVAERTADRDRMWRLTTDVMLVARFNGTITAVNPAWSTLLGWAEADLIGRSFMDFVHPDDRPSTMSEADRLADGRTTVRFRNRYRHKDGSYRWLSWTAVPNERFIHAVGRDVTEERERAEALRVTEEALRQAQKMEAIGQLTGGVAHDFNNLLTIIRSSSDLLRRPDLPDERRRRYMDAISDTVDRASKLTGQLLAFARRQALKPEVFDVPVRVRATSDMLRTIVGGRIKIVAEFDCERCFVEADVAQFETALLNMAVNARDAMEGEGTLTIRVDGLSEMPAVRGHAGGRGDFVAVSVTDTGSGIAADKLPHIFEPFFTTKEVGKGTGLGLSQVYGFAKQSGGDVSVESEVGRGTTFTLYLPSAERAPDEDDVGGQSAGTAEAGRGRRVLVVEDNVEVGTFSTQILSDLGYVTTWAANADEALRLLDETPDAFDVVFSDVVMPGMSGVDLGREIRRRYPGLPVLLTSGYSHVLAEDGRHGFELLQKPYAAEDLSAALRRLTRGRSARGRARR